MKYYLTLIISLFVLISFSQENSDTTSNASPQKYISLFHEDDPLKMFEPEEEKKEFKEKRKKKRVYYGVKTKKGFSQQSRGRNEIITVFHYTKVFLEPSIYHQKFAYVDLNDYKIHLTGHRGIQKVKEHARLLHGPYLKRLNGEIIEEGIYYFGVKHGRWMYYNSEKEHQFNKRYIRYRETVREDSIVENQIEYKDLKEKEFWDRGWPKASDITYYDREKTKIKEVIPIVNKEIHGDYYQFYENGKVKKQGSYYHNKKEGVWKEFYDGKRTHFTKLEVIYYDHRHRKEEPFEPYIKKEVDKTGHTTYEYKKGEEKKLYVEPEEEKKSK